MALQQGKYVGQHIKQRIRGKKPNPKPFRYLTKDQWQPLAKTGPCLNPLGCVFRLAAWMGWLVVHLQFIVSRENRLLIVFQWFWAWWTKGRSARLMTSPKYLNDHLGDDYEVNLKNSIKRRNESRQ